MGRHSKPVPGTTRTQDAGRRTRTQDCGYASAMNSHTRLSARELGIIFAFWTSLATLSAVNQLLDPRGFGFRIVSPAGPIAMAYIESWLWAAFTPLIFWLSSRLSIERRRWL